MQLVVQVKKNPPEAKKSEGRHLATYNYVKLKKCFYFKLTNYSIIKILKTFYDDSTRLAELL